MHAYIAKQAILNDQRHIVAYELLYRDSLENAFPAISAEIATRSLVSQHLLGSDINQLVDNKPYFINFTEQCLLDLLPLKLINRPVVIEVLEDVRPTTVVYDALQTLKQAGFLIALDDFIYTPHWQPFLVLIDIIKFDINQTSFAEIATLKSLLNKHNIKILIEKIETEQQFEQAKQLDCDYFQGYLFSTPEVILNKLINFDANDAYPLTPEKYRNNES